MSSFPSKSNGPPRNHRHQHFASKCPPPYHRHRHHHRHHHHNPHQHQHHRTGHRNFKPIPEFIPDQAINDLRDPLVLLHRDCSNFFILEETTGTVLNVQLSKTTSCNCNCYHPKCKHIKFVFMQVLGVPFNDVCLRRRSLSRSTIRRLINMPTLHESLSSFTLHLKFHEILFENTRDRVSIVIEMKDDATCQVCLDELGKEEKVVACDKCKNHVHEECFWGWKRKSLGRGLDVTCIFCRATWFIIHKEHRRINLYGKDPYAFTDDEDDL